MAEKLFLYVSCPADKSRALLKKPFQGSVPAVGTSIFALGVAELKITEITRHLNDTTGEVQFVKIFSTIQSPREISMLLKSGEWIKDL